MNCGRRLPEHARFCADCGAPTDSEATRLAAATPSAPLAPTSAPIQPRPFAPDLQRPASASVDTEQVIFNARPTLLFIGIGYVAAALAAILLIALLAFAGWDISPLIYVPLGLSLLLIPAYYHLRRNMVSYTLTDSKLVVDRGLISRTTTNVPLRNIQNVTVSASVLQRLLRFGNVRIDDANEQAAPLVLANIPDPRRHADLLLRELRRWR